MPKNYEEYLKACSRSGRWVDGPGLVAISTWLSRNLLIWKWNEDQKRYIKTALIEPHQDHPNATQHARAYPPLPLLLKQCHYMTLKPDANNPFPMTWNILPPNAHFDVRLHRGGGKSIQSWLPESFVGSWLPPSSSKQKSVRAASSTMTAKASRPKTKHSSVMSHRIAKPCNNVKRRFPKKMDNHNAKRDLIPGLALSASLHFRVRMALSWEVGYFIGKVVTVKNLLKLFFIQNLPRMPCPIRCQRTNKLGSVRCLLQLCHICHDMTDRQQLNNIAPNAILSTLRIRSGN